MTRVLIVDDSAYNRLALRRMLDAAGDIEVVGTAADGYEAIRRIRELRPDILTLDLEMPGMDGLSLLRWIRQEHRLSVLVITARTSDASIDEALRLGAVDFIRKPGRVSSRLPGIRQSLVGKIRLLASCRTGGVPSSDSPVPATTPGVLLHRHDDGEACACIILAASTGGPAALQRILPDLPAAFPTGVAIVQHMPAFSTSILARRLNHLGPLSVREARAGDTLRAGLVLIAPGGRQMDLIRGPEGTGVVRLTEGSRDDRYVPSADRLLESAAHVFGPRCAGIVLTGMGQDGTEGLAAVRRAGGAALAESEETAVVYGMPRQAVSAGVVDRIVRLDEVASEMWRLAGLRTTAAQDTVSAPQQRADRR